MNLINFVDFFQCGDMNHFVIYFVFFPFTGISVYAEVF